MDSLFKQLADAQHSGVYKLNRESQEVERQAEKLGLLRCRIDLRDVRKKKDFLTAVATALSFPDWFGYNWDALDECLQDLDWLTNRKGFVLIFANSDHFARADGQSFKTAMDVLRSASEYWKTSGRPFWALITGSPSWDSGLPQWPAS